MKKVLIISYLLTLVLQVEAQNKVYTDDKGMITLNKSGDVTMICKGNNGMVSEQISFPNEKRGLFPWQQHSTNKACRLVSLPTVKR